MNKTILLIDDSKTERLLLEKYLEDTEYMIISNSLDGHGAKELYCEYKPNITWLDVNMQRSGIDTLKELMTHDPKACIVMTSGNDNEALVKQLLRLGCFAFISKPYRPEQVLSVLEMASVRHGDNFQLSPWLNF